MTAKTARTDVEFDAAGTRLRGRLHLPRGAGPFPAVALAHGFSATAAMGLDLYAEVFAAAGIAALVYDHPNLGASDGEPRGEIDPTAQMRGYRHAIDFLKTRAEIDAGRIGVWGTSYSGGLVLVVAAIDRRVRCVVSQVPFVSGWENFVAVNPPEAREAFFRMVEEERRRLAAGEEPRAVPICVDDPAKPEASPGRRTFRYFDGWRRRGVDWRNEVTIRTLDRRLEYEAMPFAARIAPTPLLLIVAEDDDVTPSEIALRAFAAAGEPKRLLRLPGDHYAPYGERFAEAAGAARDWLVEHLGPRSGPSRTGA